MFDPRDSNLNPIEFFYKNKREIDRMLSLEGLHGLDYINTLTRNYKISTGQTLDLGAILCSGRRHGGNKLPNKMFKKFLIGAILYNKNNLNFTCNRRIKV